MAKKQNPVVIPDDIKACFNAYGFDASLKLENVVATRRAEEWFAILFYESPTGKESDPKEYWAVDFRQILDFDTKQWSWEVQNDYVGPFDSVEEFKNDPLTLTFL